MKFLEAAQFNVNLVTINCLQSAHNIIFQNFTASNIYTHSNPAEIIPPLWPNPGYTTTTFTITFDNILAKGGVNYYINGTSTNSRSTQEYRQMFDFFRSSPSPVDIAVDTGLYSFFNDYTILYKFQTSFMCESTMPNVYEMECKDLISYINDHNSRNCPPQNPVYLSYIIYQDYPSLLTADEYNNLRNYIKLPPIMPPEIYALGPRTHNTNSGFSGTYNCFAWSMGVSNYWIVPSNNQVYTLDEVTALYQNAASDHKGTWQALHNWDILEECDPNPCPAGVIDLWGVGSSQEYPFGNYVHASVKYIDPDLIDTSAGKWSSKNGEYELTSHNRNQIAGGAVPEFYGFIQLSLIPVSSFEIQEKIPTFIKEAPIYYDLQVNYLFNQIQKINPVIRQKFSKAYTEWIESYLKTYGHTSNTYHSSKLEEFKILIKLGKEIVPLLIEKMLYGNNFVNLVAYESIYDNDIRHIVPNVDWIPEQIRAIKTSTKWFHNALGQELKNKILFYIGEGKTFLDFDPNIAIKYLLSELKKIDFLTRKQFNEIYSEWIEACRENYRILHNPYDCIEVRAFKNLVTLGKTINPLFIERMLYGESFIWLVPYEAINKDNKVETYIVYPTVEINQEERSFKTMLKWFENKIKSHKSTIVKFALSVDENNNNDEKKIFGNKLHGEYLLQAVQNVKPSLKKYFDKFYNKWIEACLINHQDNLNNVYDCTSLKEFKSLVILGVGTIPLYVEKMKQGDNLALIPYEVILEGSVDYVVPVDDFIVNQERVLATIENWFRMELTGEHLPDTY